jgi:hypothetical protein
MNFSLTAQIEEVDRELEQRRKLYPSLVRSRSMRQSIADFSDGPKREYFYRDDDASGGREPPRRCVTTAAGRLTQV